MPDSQPSQDYKYFSYGGGCNKKMLEYLFFYRTVRTDKSCDSGNTT